MNVHLVTLGCARNQVDSEIMTGRLLREAWRLVSEPEDAEVIIVNTCGFIEAAVNESIDTILELASWKRNGRCRRLVVAGCLPERYREELAQSMPEVDVWLGTGAFDRIVDVVSPEAPSGCLFPDPDRLIPEAAGLPRQLTVPHTAYLKVAEGCSRHCTYCIIPKLRGRQKSRSLSDILAEADSLISAGVQELVLVAQDTTAYGQDLGPSSGGLPVLLRELANLSDRIWIRILYGHPESITDAVIQEIRTHPQICPYFDLPVQHASGRILRRMGRRYTWDNLIRLFDRIRMEIPESSLRTTLITGFPGETQEDFKILQSFIRRIRFHHLGVFPYSGSPDLPSDRLPDHVPEKTARYRRDRLMAIQMEISREHLENRLNDVVDVLIESQSQENLYIGRTWFQAPEVDGVTMVHGRGLTVGRRIPVRITDTLEYDLVGEPDE